MRKRQKKKIYKKVLMAVEASIAEAASKFVFDMGLYTVGDSWEDSTITLEDIKKAIDEMQPQLDKRREYEEKVKEYVKYLPLCPLIMKMYGSREGAFDVSPEPFVFEPPGVPMPVRPGEYSSMIAGPVMINVPLIGGIC